MSKIKRNGGEIDLFTFLIGKKLSIVAEELQEIERKILAIQPNSEVTFNFIEIDGKKRCFVEYTEEI